MKKQEENSIRTKSLFLSNMSHEIRTPLNALSGFSSILTEESIDNETRKQCSDIIQQNSELLLKLINDVIDLSSLEVGKMKFKYERCDAVAICRNVIDMVEKIKQTNANVRFSRHGIIGQTGNKFRRNAEVRQRHCHISLTATICSNKFISLRKAAETGRSKP